MTIDGGTGGINTANATTVFTTGTSEMTADAGLVAVSTAVTTATDSADKTRGAIADDVATVHTTLTGTGIAKGAVQAAGFSIYPERDYSGQEYESLGYRAAHALHVKVAPDRASEVIGLTVGTGVSETRGVAFVFTDGERIELREGALTRVVSSAKADADSVAGITDLVVTGIHTTAVGGSTSPEPCPIACARDTARASSSSTEFSLGPMTVSTTVQMAYEVESG